jgi:hypothetical protein
LLAAPRTAGNGASSPFDATFRRRARCRLIEAVGSGGSTIDTRPSPPPPLSFQRLRAGAERVRQKLPQSGRPPSRDRRVQEGGGGSSSTRDPGDGLAPIPAVRATPPMKMALRATGHHLYLCRPNGTCPLDPTDPARTSETQLRHESKILGISVFTAKSTSGSSHSVLNSPACAFFRTAS